MTHPQDTVVVVPGDPRDPQARALLEASHALMQALFDPEDNHYLSIDALCVPEIAFFVAQHGAETLGCVALAHRGTYGEVKSMFVDPKARGKGVARKLMAQLDRAAREAGLTCLKLETGDKLTEAHALYRSHGFEDCGPFGAYEANSSSLFMTKDLI